MIRLLVSPAYLLPNLSVTAIINLPVTLPAPTSSLDHQALSPFTSNSSIGGSVEIRQVREPYLLSTSPTRTSRRAWHVQSVTTCIRPPLSLP